MLTNENKPSETGKLPRKSMLPCVAIIAIVAAILIVSLLSVSTAPPRSAHSSSVRSLVMSSAQNCTLADQDSNPVIALVHATNAQAQITAARSLMSDSKLKTIASVDAAELQNVAEKKQRKAIAHVNKTCPKLMVPSDQVRAAGYVV